ncbi:MAG: macro domain-containing protein [Candidatus Heimdallarchaeota archaeon]|nr:macro domain-containing protein [Candidatus Heimdallarchaeota archaeon]
MKKSTVITIGQSTIHLVIGDVTSAKTDVIVSSDDCYIGMGGGVSAAIYAKGGSEIKQHAKKLLPCRTGDVLVTGAGKLSAKYIFHGITIDDTPSIKLGIEVTFNIVTRSLKLLENLNLSSIAFPVIGTGAAGFEISEVAIIMGELILNHLEESEKAKDVWIYLFSRSSDYLEMLNLFLLDFEELLNSDVYREFGHSMKLLNNLSELGRKRQIPAISVFTNIVKGKFALLESNLDIAEMFLDKARQIVDIEDVQLDLPEIEQDLDSLGLDINREKDRFRSKIPLLEKLQEINYNEYIDRALETINGMIDK